jgi:hypothetical protein
MLTESRHIGDVLCPDLLLDDSEVGHSTTSKLTEFFNSIERLCNETVPTHVPDCTTKSVGVAFYSSGE